MISHRHRCVFVHIPKCAGTSIEQKLGLFDVLERGVQDHSTIRDVEPLSTIGSFGLLARRDDDLTARWAVKEALRRLPGGVSRRFLPTQYDSFYRPRLTRQQFETYFKFAVVRNPWARVYSWYRNLMRDPEFGYPQMSYTEFLRDHADASTAVNGQLYWLKGFDGRIAVDRIVRFEHLREEIAEVFARLGFDDTDLPHLLAEGGEEAKARYVDAYDDETEALVSRRYREEIELFDYRFGD